MDVPRGGEEKIFLIARSLHYERTISSRKKVHNVLKARGACFHVNINLINVPTEAVIDGGY